MLTFVDKNGRTIHVTVQIPEGAAPRDGGQSRGSKSGDELVKELFDKYVPDSEFVSRP